MTEQTYVTSQYGIARQIAQFLQHNSKDRAFFRAYCFNGEFILYTIGVFRHKHSVTITHHGSYYAKHRYRGSINNRAAIAKVVDKLRNPEFKKYTPVSLSHVML